MAKKLNFTSLFYKTITKPGRSRSSPPPHPWPRTSRSSEREVAVRDFDYSESCFSTASSPSTISTAASAPPGDGSGGDAIEAATMRGMRSDRLFFEPTATTSMLTAEAAAFEGSVAVAVDSADPYSDFKVSMEEMVVAHGGARDWEWLEELLGWYLRMNGKRTHGIIVAAFLDLLLGFAVSSSPFITAE